MRRCIVCYIALLAWIAISPLAVAAQSTAAPRTPPTSLARLQPGEVGLINVEARRAGIRNFRLQNTVSPSGRLVVQGFTGNLGGGAISGTGFVDFANDEGPHRMNLSMTDADAQAMLKMCDLSINATIRARVNGLFALSWNGLSMSQGRRTMSGTLEWKSGAGTVEGASVLDQAAAFTGIQELRRLEFSYAEAAGTITGGVIHAKAVHVVGPLYDIEASGTVDLPTQRAHLTAKVKISPELAARSSRAEIRALGSVASYGTSRRKRPEQQQLLQIPFALELTGPVDDLSVSLARLPKK